MKIVKKLEDSELWKKVSEIGKELKDILEHIPEEDSYPIGFKIKQYSFDISSWIAEGVGSIDPRDRVWQYGKARSELFAAKDAYKQACNLGYIKLDPSFMVQIESATQLLDKEIKESRVDIPKWFSEMGGQEEKKL
jgi:hypothetical protein